MSPTLLIYLALYHTEAMATSQSRTLIATNALFLGLAAIAVIMRIYARKQKVRYLQAEDYLILAALVKPLRPSMSRQHC